MDFIRSGPGRWTARNNSAGIYRDSETGEYVRTDGYGRETGRYRTLQAAKSAAWAES